MGILLGNLIVMVVGLKLFELLCVEGLYDELEVKSKVICEGFEVVVKKVGIVFIINYVGGMYGFFFIDKEKVISY